MKIGSLELLLDLTERTQEVKQKAENLLQKSVADLNKKASPTSWSALECMAHLNLYGDFYIPEISIQIKNSKHGFSENFRSGLIGNYFAKSMAPKEKLNKMKTLKATNTLGSNVDVSCIHEFINQQNQMLPLLDAAKKVSLTKTKTGISIASWLRLRLGDTFRVVIYHNQRHLIQAENALK